VLLACCSPDAAQPHSEAAENFPYPAEYAYKPADDAAPHHSTPTAEPIIEQEIENFPYPAEYAYHADATHTTTQTQEADVLEEEEEGEPGGWAGVRATGNEQASPPAQSAEQPAAPVEAAKVTSATYTLEGETQQHSLTQRAKAAIDQLVDAVRLAMPEVPPFVHDVFQVYGDAWRWLMRKLFPKPLTPAEGERTSSRPAVATMARCAGRTAADGVPNESTAQTATVTLSAFSCSLLLRLWLLCCPFFSCRPSS